MKMLVAVFALVLLSAGCAVIPGAPQCDRVKYERDGEAFKFYCEGSSAGMFGTKPL